MSIVRKKTAQLKIADSFYKLKDTVYGGLVNKINNKKERYDSDFINVSMDSVDDNSDVFFDEDLGINKKYWFFHDINWHDEYKNTNIKRRRKISELEEFRVILDAVKQKKG